MKTALQITLYFHIAAGLTSLICGLIAILTEKGMKVHRAVGKIYFWGMIVVAVTAIFIAVFKELNFLLMVAVFSFYMTYTGRRAIMEKRRRAKWYDWGVMTIVGACNLFMFASGEMILIVFGIILLSFIISDARTFLMKEPPSLKSKAWLLTHIPRMLGSYIATTTAFVVVNFSNMVPYPWIVWLGPTIIGTPLIFYFVSKNRPKTVQPSTV